ncbi:RidA family protein [Kitasatospora sp. NBC_00070]|uniref:RidA family protein n=1 Tax=Kitasatospora sp. NBC_00070 TaxID=2975962 RepID=UPI0038600D27
MSHTIVNPTAFGYSQAAVTADGTAWIAGQYAADADGNLVPGDFAEQVRRSLANLGTALAAVGLDYQHVVRLGSFVVDHDLEKLAELVEQLTAIWGDRPPAQTLSGVAALALPGMLFEIDAVAVR